MLRPRSLLRTTAAARGGYGPARGCAAPAFRMLRVSGSRYGEKRSQSGYSQGAYTQQALPLRQRSGPARFFFRFGVYGLGAFFCVMTGAALAVFIGPDSAKLRSVIGGKAPTAAESLKLYTPPDSDSARINDAVVSNPIAIELRANPDFKESRPHAGMPPGMRPSSLTGGTLSGPGRITVPALMFNEKEGKSLVSIFHLGDELCGHVGIVHGGLLATLLDEGLARCCFPALPNKVAVTASLKMTYLKPAKADNLFVLRATTESIDGRKAKVTGYIEQLPREGEDGEPVKVVKAEALYIEPKNAQYLNMIRRRVESSS